VSTSVFSQQLASVEPDGHPGRYRADVSDIWNCPIVPHGGLVTALTTHAVQTELALPQQRLRAVTAVFADQVKPGPVEIDVTVLRRGRSMSQATATIRNVGAAAGHTLVTVFGAGRPGYAFVDATFPDVPGPGECPSFRDPPPEGFDDGPPFNFWEHLEGRAALGHAPWDDTVRLVSDCAAWMRFDEPPMLDDGRLDPLALVTMSDTMPGAVGERLGRADHFWLPPSADLTVHLLGDARSEWILGHKRARYSGDGYASVEMLLWDMQGTLVAYATQMMFFVFPEGPPPEHERVPRAG
jgi:acyl-CoA thioesterase